MASDARAPYVVAGAAMREAIVKACMHKLLQSDWRVFGAVLVLLPSYSRVEDEAYVAQVAAIANLSPRTARRALKTLADLEIIGYNGRRGPGRKPLISLPIAAQSGHHDGQLQTGHDEGQSSPEDWPASRPPDWPASRPTTEKVLREEEADVVLDGLEELLRQIDFTPAQRIRARTTDRPRAIAWLERAAQPDIDNAAAYAWTGINGDTWPTPPPGRKAGATTKSIDLAEAWQLFLDSPAWDEHYDQAMILDELRTRRRGRTNDDLTDQQALDLWREVRARRYPGLDDPEPLSIKREVDVEDDPEPLASDAQNVGAAS